MARPTYLLQVAFASNPDDGLGAQVWTDITSRLDVAAGVRIDRGRTDEQGDVQPSKLTCSLDNRDGALTPGRPGSPYAPNVVTGKWIRLALIWAGTTYWRFTGRIGELPTGWDGGPAVLAVTALAAADPFARLGDLGEYRTTLDEDVLDDTPFAYYPLSEPAGVAGSTASAGDISGNDETPLTLRQVGAGGAVTFGSAPGVPDFYQGRRTTVAINPASAGNGAYLRAALKRPPAAGGAPGLSVAVFAQESVSPLATGPLAIITGADGSWFGVNKAGSGNITAAFYSADTGVLSEVVSGIGMSSAEPRLYAAVLDVPAPGQGRITFYLNGVAFGAAVTFAMAAVPTPAVVSVGGRGFELVRGYLSHAAFFNQPVTAAAIAGWWFSAFRGTDGAGSTSYARLAKLCVYSGLGTLLWFNGGAGFTPQAVGPQEIEGRPLEAMRLVEATEGGMFYMRGDGAPILQLRAARYNQAPALTVAADRLDPDSITFRGDDYGLVNDVTAARPDGAAARIVNAASVAASGRRKTSLEAIATTDDGLRAIAAWTANTGGVQRNRVTGVKVSLLNDPGLLPAALALGLGQKIAVTGLPSQAPGAALELFAEGWTERIGETEWSMDFTTSPAEAFDVWQIGVPGHSEIGTTTRIAY